MLLTQLFSRFLIPRLVPLSSAHNIIVCSAGKEANPIQAIDINHAAHCAAYRTSIFKHLVFRSICVVLYDIVANTRLAAHITDLSTRTLLV